MIFDDSGAYILFGGYDTAAFSGEIIFERRGLLNLLLTWLKYSDQIKRRFYCNIFQASRQKSSVSTRQYEQGSCSSASCARSVQVFELLTCGHHVNSSLRFVLR